MSGANHTRIKAVSELRRSGAYGPHQDRRHRRRRTRGAVRRAATERELL